jgi:quercetin dioxygenase-like cupin family protein
MSDRITTCSRGSSPAGHFSVVEYSAAPGAGGPPPHVHRSNEEAFFVLEGQVDFTLDGTTERMTKGSFVLVPKGAVHTFVNAGSGVARWMGVFAPGQYEQLVRELGAIIPKDGPPDPAEVAAVFARWDTEIVA